MIQSILGKASGFSSTKRAAILMLAVAPAMSLFSSNASATTDTWASAAVGNWSTGTWTGGNPVPVSGDSLIFGGSFVTPSTDDIAGLSINGITFSSGAIAYTLNTAGGVQLVLGTPDVPGTTGFGSIVNSSSVIQTIAMNIDLAAGNHAITGGGAVTSALAFNPVGGLVRNAGATVAFSGNVTTSTVTNGSGGIIGGFATVGTNWATVSGSNIVALGTYTDITTSGTITSGGTTNVRISSGAAGSVTLTTPTGTTDINTLMQNVDSIAETVSLGTATLRFGAEGGIFRTGVANTTNGLQITGGFITAGGADNTNGNLTINGGAGTGTGTVMLISSQIVDNGSGVVSVIKTGRGYLNMSNSTNSYTGGTFINEGRVAGTGNALGGGSWGTGNITVQSGGEITPGGTVNNNLFIAGSGPQNELGNGAIRGGTINGPIVLLGDASISASTLNSPISGNFNLSFGPLSNVGGTATTVTLANNTATANSWGGNTNIVAHTTTSGQPMTLKLGASEQIPDASTVSIGNAGITATATITFDLNGFNETINGLTSVGGTATSQFVINNSATADSTLTIGGANGNGTFNGAINAGTGAHVLNIVKNGTGTEVFAGNSSYVGTTTVNNGALFVTGTLASPQITVNGGIFGGNSTLAGNVTIQAGAHLAPGANAAGGVIGTLVINGTNGLTVSGDVALDLGAPAINDLVTVNGPVTFNAGSSLTLNSGTIGSSYVVLTSNAPITYTGTPSLFATGDPTVRPTVYSMDTSVATQITINVVSGGARSLTWTGGNNGNWDINTTPNNWVNTIPTSDVFFNADSVAFTDSGGNKSITISGTVLPGGAVTVSNSAGNDYTFGGGIIGGSASVAKTGAGNLTVTSNNTYTGGTTLDATSTINVGGGTGAGALGSGIVTNAGTLILDRNNATSFPNEIDGAGNVSFTGGGTYTLGTLNTYSGTTNVNANSTVIVSGNTTLGNTTTVNVSGGGTLDVSTAPAALNLGAKQFNIAGNGTSGTGVIFDNGATSKTAAFELITLTANSSIFVGASARDDLRNGAPLLELGTFTLTKNGGGQFTMVGGTLDGTGANMMVNAGLFSFQTTSHTTGTGTITEAPGIDAEFYQTGVGNFTWNLVLQGNNTLSSANGTTANIDGPVSFAGALSIGATNGISGHADANNFPLSVNSNLTQSVAGSSVTKFSIDTVTLGGVNNWTGSTTIGNGTLKLGSSTGLPTGTAVVMGDAGANSGTLDLNGFNATVGSLTNGAGTGTASAVTNNAGATTSVLTYAGGTSSFSGAVQDGAGVVALSVTGGSLTLSGTVNYTGNTSVNAGATLSLGSASSFNATTNVTANGTINLASATQTIASLNSTSAGALNLNTTVLTVTGGGSFVGTISGAAPAGLVVFTGSALTTDAVNVGSLEVDGTHVIRSHVIPTVSKINSLIVAGSYGGTASAVSAWAGTLDLTNSKLIVEDASDPLTRANDIAEIKNEALASNSNSGTVGIVSSTANAANIAAGKIVKVVAVSDNAVRMATFPSGSTNFGGTNNVDANSILVAAVFKGDANMDGVVDIQDLTDVANHWQQSVTDWSQGDFDGSNFVDIQDLTSVANNWQAGVGAGGGESFSDALAQIGGFKAAIATPEPASLAVLGLGGLVLSSRRRRQV